MATRRSSRRQAVSSARSKAQAALEKLGAARNGNTVDLSDDSEDDDIFDRVTEEEYRKIVRDRRKREEFVVDDDNTGYYDDGEEHWDADTSGSVSAPQGKKSMSLNSRQSAEKSSRSRARGALNAAALQSHRNAHREKMDDHAAGSRKIGDMFLGMSKIGQKSSVIRKRGSVASSSSTSLSSSTFSTNVSGAANLDLDSMLDDLTADPMDRLTSGKSALLAEEAHMAKRRKLAREEALPLPRSVQSQEEDVVMTAPVTAQGKRAEDAVRNDDGTVSMPTDASAGTSNSADANVEKSGNVAEMGTTAEEKGEQDAEENRPKTTTAKERMAAAARMRKKKKLAAARAARAARAAAEMSNAAAANTGDLPVTDAGTGGWWDMCNNNGATGGTNKLRPSSTTAANAVEELQHVVMEEKDGDGNSVKTLRMYWLDIFEDRVLMPGRLFIFGKVWHPVQKKHVSCCVTVRGHERQLFFLPRGGSDGSPPDMMALYQEIKSILVGKIIPTGKQDTFRCKPVERSYAFEVAGVPRQATKYMKCKYSAVFPPLDPATTGKHFSKVFGAKTSTLENFILKRKLMGPCWIDIRNPQPGRNQSWCKVEAEVLNPKNVTVCEARAEDGSPLPAPPLTVMSISLKTRTDLRTQTNEVALVSLLMHDNVSMDSPTKDAMGRKNLTVFSTVRAIGRPGENGCLPSDYRETLRKKPGLNMTVHANERGMLNWLMSRIHLCDPDVLVGHSINNFELEILMTRMAKHKIQFWSKLGRLRRSKNPFIGNGNTRFAVAAAGRLVCDTYITSKELLLREANYRLETLAKKFCDGDKHVRINPVDVPLYYRSTTDLIRLQHHTENTAFLSMKLMFKLEMIPLTKQLTNIGGNLWKRTLSGGRAERIEYLLLHAFHRKKYVVPDKQRGKKSDGRRGKPKYAGGLVLEPKKGLYDKYTLLLDFNSLYPSIIQEYNLCFTTVDRDLTDGAGGIVRMGNQHAATEETDSGEMRIPQLPDLSQHSNAGVLPTLIRSLVEKRAVLKVALKEEQDPVKKKMVDVRQKALKITANSMYGCLGFSNSRFYAAPIAALVTSTGREILQRTVDMANGMGYNVIYGDTDSIMVYTGLDNLAEVEQIGKQIKVEVNKLYRLLEIEIDGVYKSMLLLKKKKYAALSVVKAPGPGKEYHLEKETKGLDLVRRDWCGLSKVIGHFVLDEVLSGKPCDEVVNSIHAHLSERADSLRSGKVPLEQLIITKGLNKAPKDYPDAKGMAHLQVALAMVKAGKPVNVGDHIPYVICREGGKSAAERAYHPDQVKQAAAKAPEGSTPSLTIDVEWYLAQQILPPTARLCDPIDGTSQSAIAEQLGLDLKKYGHMTYDATEGLDDEDMVGFKPMSEMTDEERYKDVEPLMVLCPQCHHTCEFPGLYRLPRESANPDENSKEIRSGLECPVCKSVWSQSHLQNNVDIVMGKLLRSYYAGESVCNDPTCQSRTRQLSVAGNRCIVKGCGSLTHEVTSATKVFTQMKYMEMLFDTAAWETKLRAAPKGCVVASSPSREEKEACDICCSSIRKYLSKSRYNWVSKDIWSKVYSSKKLLPASTSTREMMSP